VQLLLGYAVSPAEKLRTNTLKLIINNLYDATSPFLQARVVGRDTRALRPYRHARTFSARVCALSARTSQNCSPR
jgi:hypothetical protein